jgi:ectoine hydroxylase
MGAPENRPGQGTGLFFHANTLHCSAPNNSPHSRWSLICCYNAAHNDPYKESHHPRYTPLSKVDDSLIKQVGRLALTDSARAYMNPDEDHTTAATNAP